MRILIADEDKEFMLNFKSFIEDKYKFQVDIAYDGREVQSLYEENKYDYVILYDNLSLIPGFSLIGILRKTYNCFVAITSKRNDSFYQKYIYSQGANDFYEKPLDLEIISSKIYNYKILGEKKMLRIGGLEIDSEGRNIYVDGVCKTLTLKEYDLLTYLIKNRGKAVSREQIFKEVWNFAGSSVDDRTIDTYIKMLRNQLGIYKNYIETYRGFGYKFEVN